jgi:hypothetical protein
MVRRFATEKNDAQYLARGVAHTERSALVNLGFQGEVESRHRSEQRFDLIGKLQPGIDIGNGGRLYHRVEVKRPACRVN